MQKINININNKTDKYFILSYSQCILTGRQIRNMKATFYLTVLLYMLVLNKFFL